MRENLFSEFFFRFFLKILRSRKKLIQVAWYIIESTNYTMCIVVFSHPVSGLFLTQKWKLFGEGRKKFPTVREVY